MSSYIVVIERGEKSYGAYVPDLPGCVAVGKTAAEVRTLIRGAIALHVNGMREDGLKIPKPSSTVRHIQVGRLPIQAPLKWVTRSHNGATAKKTSRLGPSSAIVTKTHRKKASATLKQKNSPR